MKNQIIHIEEEKAFPLAEKRFVKTCGFDLSKTKHQRMMKMGLEVREKGIGGIDLNAVVSCYGPEAFQDGKVNIDGTEFACNFFAQIPEGAVEGIYFYMLTAGECYFSSEENIMDFLFADIWGTNYVDAGIELLREKLKADAESRFGKALVLSEEFGPGYFGMPVIESRKFFQILQGDLIQVEVKDSGLMIPQKTCTGLYLVLNDPEIKAEPECIKCLGNTAGCSFCKIRQRLDEVQR